MLEYFSRSFDESIINERKKREKKTTEKFLVIEDSRYILTIENYFWSLDRFFGEEGEEKMSRERTRKSCHVCIWKNERTHEMADALWRPIARSLSHNRRFVLHPPALISPDVGKPATLYARDVLLCDLCCVLSGSYCRAY